MKTSSLHIALWALIALNAGQAPNTGFAHAAKKAHQPASSMSRLKAQRKNFAHSSSKRLMQAPRRVALGKPIPDFTFTDLQGKRAALVNGEAVRSC